MNQELPDMKEWGRGRGREHKKTSFFNVGSISGNSMELMYYHCC
jgi:hypothetical protein